MTVTLITSLGQQAISNAIANNDTVKIAKIAVGDGNGANYTPTTDQTTLKNVKWSGALDSISLNPENANQIICEGKIASGIGGFYIREVGLYNDKNELIAVSDFPESFKATADQYELFIRMILEVDSANAIVNVNKDIIYATKAFVIENMKDKVVKEDGKMLSANDYTNEDKQRVQKIGNIEELSTSSKTSLVLAINEVQTNVLTNKTDTSNLQINIIDLAIETETLKNAELNGVTANIAIETFLNLDDVTLERGAYNTTNKWVEV